MASLFGRGKPSADVCSNARALCHHSHVQLPNRRTCTIKEFAQQMSEDFLHRDRAHLNNPQLPHADRHTHLCVHNIHQQLRNHGYHSDDCRLPPLPANFMPHDLPLEEQINVIEEQQLGAQMYHQLNFDQQQIPNAILHAINHQLPEMCFYIDGSGGIGKTFLYNTGPYYLRNADFCHMHCFLRSCCDTAYQWFYRTFRISDPHSIASRVYMQ